MITRVNSQNACVEDKQKQADSFSSIFTEFPIYSSLLLRTFTLLLTQL